MTAHDDLFKLLPSADDAHALPLARRVKSSNAECLLCNGSVVHTARPVVSYACGHACHATCAAKYMVRGPGQECPDGECMSDPEEARRLQAREAVAAAISCGTLDAADATRPMKRDDLAAGIRNALQQAGLSAISAMSQRYNAWKLRNADGRTRRLQQYEATWRAKGMATDGVFPYQITRALMAPYTTGVKNLVSVDRNVTFARLMEAERCRRRDVSGAAPDMSLLYTAGTTGTEALVHPDFEMRKFINMNLLLEHGVTISDMFYALEITSFDDLMGLGLSVNHLTDRSGPMPLLPLMDLYNVSASTVEARLGLTARHLFGLKVDADTMRNAGIHFNLLAMLMHMDKETFMALGATPTVCRDYLFAEVSSLTKFGLRAKDFVQMRWDRDDFQDVYAISDKAMNLIWPAHVQSAPQVSVHASVVSTGAAAAAAQEIPVGHDDFYGSDPYGGWSAAHYEQAPQQHQQQQQLQQAERRPMNPKLAALLGARRS